MNRPGVGCLALLIKLLPKGIKLVLAGASLASFAYLLTWKMAVLMMMILAVHEVGHVWAMEDLGMKVKGMYFIPFFGAIAVPDDKFPSRGGEYQVAIMGPVWGMAMAVCFLVIYELTSNPLLAIVAFWTAALNLVNLLPINPMDGGRCIKSVCYSIHSGIGYVATGVSFLILILLSSYINMGLFAYLYVAGVIDLLAEHSSSEPLPDMKVNDAVWCAIAYVGLVLLLWGIMAYTSHVPGAQAALEFFRS